MCQFKYNMNRDYKQMDINHHPYNQYQQYQPQNNLMSTRQPPKKRRNRNKKNKEQVNSQPQPIAISNRQRRDRGVANSTNNQRTIYRAQQRLQIHQQNSIEQAGQNLESISYNQSIGNQHTRQFYRQPNVSVSIPPQDSQGPEDPQDPEDSEYPNQPSEYGSLFQMSEMNFNFEQSLDIQNFILQNTIGECAKYRLPKRNIRIDDRFTSKTRYQLVLRELVKLEMVSDVNRRIQQKDEEVYQREIKVKLAQHLIYNEKIRQHQKIVLLKASNTRNYYYLEQTLIKGKRLGIMTRSLPFKTENLQTKMGETRLCFIWKDKKTGNIVVKGLDQLEIGHPQEQNLLHYNQDKEQYQRLQHDEYFFMDLDSIISSIRQYRAVQNSPNFPLIKQIIGNAQIRGNRQQLKERREYLVGSQIINNIRANRNRSQLNAIQNIFWQQKGIFLIQGPPGTGKTQTIVNFTSLQQQYFSLKKDQDQCSKVMICAQSNAAVNHIGRKIMTDRLIGRQEMPQILRLGHTEQFDELLLSINLPHLCQIKLRRTENNKDDWSAKLRWQKLVLQAKINKMMKQGYQKNQIRRQKDQLYYKIKRLVQIHFEIQEQKGKYELIQEHYLAMSQIVLTTLNTSGKKKFADFYRDKIRCLIIDEASQATQPSTLIPFMTNVQKIILVGDHMQLQPTVMSTNCKYTNYNRSLFQRLVNINRIPFLLNTQYRMVKTLQQFPSKQFYQGRLKLGKKIIVPNSLAELSSSSMFFNVNYGQEEKLKKSYQNQAEAYCVSILIGRLMYYDSSLKIGVIAPYKSQIKHLQSQILQVPMSDQERDNLKISTVDAFQGQQMDVIIISCVRSNPQRTIGFVKDEKRMNVAITRAKYALFVFGNANTLSIDKTWRDYIAHHRTKDSFYDIKNYSQCDQQIRSLVKLRKQDQKH